MLLHFYIGTRTERVLTTHQLLMAQRDRSEEDLDPRCREVLREVVIHYVSTGEPVSSRTLAKSGKFGLSPASLRNAMADLEDSGFLYQPHTSAGRVPTDRGYRFFITHLMRSRRLSAAEMETIDEQFAQTGDLEEVVNVASRLLSKMSDQVGIVFLPTLQHLVMRSINFIRVSDTRLMVVVVTSNGMVVNRIVEASSELTREELESIGRYLTIEYEGRSLVAIRDRLSRMLAEERARYDALHRRTITLGIDAIEDVLPHERELVVEGAVSMLNKPEFSDAGAMRRTMAAFEEREKLIELLNRCLDTDGVQILIGSESRFTESYNLSLVAARYGPAGAPAGTVGVIGPTRMEYSRMATLVDYLGRALSRKIEESAGEES